MAGGIVLQSPVSSSHRSVPGMVLLSMYVLTSDNKLIFHLLQIKLPCLFDENWVVSGLIHQFCETLIACPVGSIRLLASGMVLLSFSLLTYANECTLNPLQVELIE